MQMKKSTYWVQLRN